MKARDGEKGRKWRGAVRERRDSVGRGEIVWERRDNVGRGEIFRGRGEIVRVRGEIVRGR